MKSPETQPAAPEQDLRAKETTIKRGVLTALGSPRDLFGVKVCRLWDNCYRVNVLIGNDITSTSVANSYFITTDTVGNILRSEPAISQKYGLEDRSVLKR